MLQAAGERVEKERTKGCGRAEIRGVHVLTIISFVVVDIILYNNNRRSLRLSPNCSLADWNKTQLRNIVLRAYDS